MDAVDGSAGQPSVLTMSRFYPTALLQGIVELSEVSRCQLGEQFCPQAGLHMMFHISAIVFQRARPEDDRHLLQPCVQPLPECHPALLR